MDIVAHEAGMTAFSGACWRLAALILIPSVIILAGGYIYELKTEPKTETRVVFLNEQTRVMATAMARTWTPDDRAKANVARDWVWHMRSRDTGDAATATYRQVAATYTSQAAGEAANVLLRELDTELEQGSDGSEDGYGMQVMGDILMSVVGHDPETETAIVSVLWKERTWKDDGHTGPWEDRHMYVHIREIRNEETAKVMENGLDLYVVGFSADRQHLAPAGRRRRSVMRATVWIEADLTTDLVAHAKSNYAEKAKYMLMDQKFVSLPRKGETILVKMRQPHPTPRWWRKLQDCTVMATVSEISHRPGRKSCVSVTALMIGLIAGCQSSSMIETGETASQPDAAQIADWHVSTPPTVNPYIQERRSPQMKNGCSTAIRTKGDVIEIPAWHPDEVYCFGVAPLRLTDLELPPGAQATHRD